MSMHHIFWLILVQQFQKNFISLMCMIIAIAQSLSRCMSQQNIEAMIEINWCLICNRRRFISFPYTYICRAYTAYNRLNQEYGCLRERKFYHQCRCTLPAVSDRISHRGCHAHTAMADSYSLPEMRDNLDSDRHRKDQIGIGDFVTVVMIPQCS